MHGFAQYLHLKGDTICIKLDLTRDPGLNEKRDCQAIRDALEMTACSKVPDSNAQAIQIQNTLADMFQANSLFSGEVKLVLFYQNNKRLKAKQVPMVVIIKFYIL